jgi:hypothetical protein
VNASHIPGFASFMVTGMARPTFFPLLHGVYHHAWLQLNGLGKLSH